MNTLRERLGSERAAAYLEYAFLVALIAVVCLVAITYFGLQTNENFSSTSSRIGHADYG